MNQVVTRTEFPKEPAHSLTVIPIPHGGWLVRYGGSNHELATPLYATSDLGDALDWMRRCFKHGGFA